MLTPTFDIEDHRGDAPGPKRHAANTETLLAATEAHGARATFFVVGDLVDSDPALLRRIADGGHEIGLHSFDHAPLQSHASEVFRRRTEAAKKAVEDCAGTGVVGYRAPSFSLTRRTPWVPRCLMELGFRYSSSVLPAGSPLFGFPGAPRRPFRWDCGLLELPSPVARIGPATVPYLGGIYFRYLPDPLIRHHVRRGATAFDGAASNGGASAGLWSYLHPYDIDPEEPFCRPHGAPLWMSLLLHAKRAGARAKLDRMLSGRLGVAIARPLAERVDAGHFDAAAPFALDA